MASDSSSSTVRLIIVGDDDGFAIRFLNLQLHRHDFALDRNVVILV
jgi:hypothetical protein